MEPVGLDSIELQLRAKWEDCELKSLGEQAARICAFKEALGEQAQRAKRQKKQLAQDAQNRLRDGEIADAAARYDRAVAAVYAKPDPHGSLRRAALWEKVAFDEDRDRLTVLLAQAQDPNARREIELRLAIEAHDYMEITGTRQLSILEAMDGREKSLHAYLFLIVPSHSDYNERARELREERLDVIEARETEAREAASRRGETVAPLDPVEAAARARRNDINLRQRWMQRDIKRAPLPADPTDTELGRRTAVLVAALQTLRERDERIRAFEDIHDAQAATAKRRKRQLARSEALGRHAGDIADPEARYAISLGKHYRSRELYASLSRAAYDDRLAFEAGQARLRAEIAAEHDQIRRRELELRQSIEAHDYMAITSQRMSIIRQAQGNLPGSEPVDSIDAEGKAHAATAMALRVERATLLAAQPVP